MSFEAPIWDNLVFEGLSGVIQFGTHSTLTISTTSSAVAIPFDLGSTETIDLFQVYLASGASTAFRCRIVSADASTGNPTSTLVDANATSTITATSGGLNTFDFTDFSLASGSYWIVLDSTATPSTALEIHYAGDYVLSNNSNSGVVARYWTGSAWASISAGFRGIRARLKTASGWHCIRGLVPFGSASGVESLVMDTSENPACRGNRFVAPWSGEVCGFNISVAGFSSGTSFDFVLANSGCSTELARIEVFYNSIALSSGKYRIRFPAVSVVAGTSYDVYIKAGSQAGTTTGVIITALDTSEDSGAVIGCYGVEPGDILGLYVHSPVTEGGSDTPTTTADHVFPWVPVYSEITTGGGSGGETSHVFVA